MANEKRMIDANAVLAGIETFMQCYAEKEKELTPFWVKVAIQALEMARQLIKEMPTVDAVEVVHGRWIEHPNVEIVDGKPISNYECSECCCFYRTHENYCGYCGAKMDGDGNGST